MNELLTALANCHFDVPHLALDGKVARFDREGKGNAWFIGFQSFSTKSGEPLVVAIFGDWKTAERYEFKSQIKMSKEDQALVKEKLKEAGKLAEAERKRVQEEVSRECETRWDGCSHTGESEYLKRKKLAGGLYGARASFTGSGYSVFVPMRDIEGKLWGLQQIQDSGSKFFQPGQKVEGCFHVIPEDADLELAEVVYLGEGFATMATVQEATKRPVIVAFNANNLEAVGRVIRAKYPNAAIVVCGDDDQFNERGNAGREAAEATAQKILGKSVFPRFENLTEKPTDFNDLYCLEGLEKVTEQILGVVAEKNYVIPLGFKEETYYYTSSSNPQIVSIVSHADTSLLNLMPLEYWTAMYPSKTGVDWNQAKSDLMRQARSKGIFANNRIRGIGVWFDDGRLVIHLGDRLFYEGKDHHIHDIKSRFIYQLGPAVRPLAKRALTLAECKTFHDILGKLNFERVEQQYFLGGWIALARLSGALAWRPHIWVTGKSGSGKSTIMNQFINPMLGDLRHKFDGGSTEAGMRQTIKANAVPVIYDEFEPDDQGDMRKIRACLEFIRQASTDSGGVIVKGSADGNAVEYQARFCAVVSAVKTLLNTEADRNRFTLIEICKGDQSQAQWDGLKSVLAEIDSDYVERMFSRMVAMFPIILENQGKLQRSFAARHSQRLGQQYGTLMAGYMATTMDTALTQEEADRLVAGLDISQEVAVAQEPDEIQCVQFLLAKKVSVEIKGDRYDRTLSECIHFAKLTMDPESDLYNDALMRYGMKIVKDQLFISSNNTQLRDIFEGSEWSGGWAGSIGRLTGAKKNFKAFIHGRTISGTMIPLSQIANSS